MSALSHGQETNMVSDLAKHCGEMNCWNWVSWTSMMTLTSSGLKSIAIRFTRPS